MRPDRRGSRLLAALTDATPAFVPISPAAHNPRISTPSQRLLAALTDATPAFQPVSTQEDHQPAQKATDQAHRNAPSGAVGARPGGGSWFRRLWEEKRELLHVRYQTMRPRVEYAIEQRLNVNRAEIDKANADAVAALAASIAEHDDAVIRIGALIIVKTGGRVIVHQLSASDVARLEAHNELLADPQAAARFVQDLQNTKPGSDPAGTNSDEA